LEKPLGAIVDRLLLAKGLSLTMSISAGSFCLHFGRLRDGFESPKRNGRLAPQNGARSNFRQGHRDLTDFLYQRDGEVIA